jgi:outer membrane immunogenic protein
MRCIALALLCSTAICGAAAAADIPARTYTKAPAILAGYNWSGAYIGIMGGYAWGGDGVDLDGGFIGGTIGYNWQGAGSPWVFGIEADAAWANFGNTFSATSGGVTVTLDTDADFIATIRGRLGYAMDRTLLYVTGGGAFVRNEISVTVAGGGLVLGATDDQWHTGWTLGAGVEHAFTPNWRVKLEYLYMDFGSENYFGGALASGDLDVHTVKLGLNYRF